ncbi:unnamed protein product, partial [marine sediment metagenome]
SEFYLPQISLTASSVLITDTTAIDEQAGRVSDSSYDVQMRDVRLKKGKRTLFYWPFMRSNLERPDIPIKSLHVGHDSTFGTFVEQRDTLNLGVSQRLLTRRGSGDSRRTVEWMRLDTDVTWVNNSGGADSGPDRFIWARPIVPLLVLSAPEIFNGDLVTHDGVRATGLH